MLEQTDEPAIFEKLKQMRRDAIGIRGHLRIQVHLPHNILNFSNKQRPLNRSFRKFLK